MSSRRYLRHLPTATACSEARPRSRTSKSAQENLAEVEALKNVMAKYSRFVDEQWLSATGRPYGQREDTVVTALPRV
jgi:hypothetical protein